MAQLVPVRSITPASETQSAFELTLPNSLLGKTVFLRLPAQGGWHYEVNPGDLRAERNLIFRDRMWVTRGKARFLAVHEQGTRLNVTLKIRPWKPSAIRNADGRAPWLTPDDERSPLLLGQILRWLGNTSHHRLRICCHWTERQIEIRAQHADKTGSGEVLAGFLADLQCHA